MWLVNVLTWTDYSSNRICLQWGNNLINLESFLNRCSIGVVMQQNSLCECDWECEIAIFIRKYIVIITLWLQVVLVIEWIYEKCKYHSPWADYEDGVCYNRHGKKALEVTKGTCLALSLHNSLFLPYTLYRIRRH